MKWVGLNFRRDITETESWVILRAEDRSKLKSFRAMMTNCLWQFMQNTSQSWNKDVMAFLCTGRVEVVKTRAGNADQPSNSQFLPLYSNAKKDCCLCHLLSVYTMIYSSSFYSGLALRLHLQIRILLYWYKLLVYMSVAAVN